MHRNADRLVLTCEHASQSIPHRYRALFARAQRVLQTHRGCDIGASEMSRYLARALDVETLHATASRLLVDCNRSPGHRRLFSVQTRQLPDAERARILARYYYPHRQAVEQRIDQTIAAHGQAVHISVHSFVGKLDGKKRGTDIGLLYDPARAAERTFCAGWQKRLQAAGEFRVRRNYPYKGVSDGLVTHLRKHRPANRYLAIELEFNQDLVNTQQWPLLKKILAQTLRHMLEPGLLSDKPQSR